MADMDSLGTAALLNGGLGGTSNWLWILLFFGFFLFNNGGMFGANGGYATSSEVQRGFDNQNTVANQREALAAINAGTAQSVAAVNQAKYDNINVAKDIQLALSQQIGQVANIETSILDKIQSCCCETNMNIAQNTSRILEAMAQNKIENLQSQVSALQLQNAISGVVKYPMATTYNAGLPPFNGGIAPFTPFA